MDEWVKEGDFLVYRSPDGSVTTTTEDVVQSLLEKGLSLQEIHEVLTCS